MVQNTEFGFEEALAILKAGGKVINDLGRTYVMESGKLICYPKEGSSQHYTVDKLFTDAIFSSQWRKA